MELPSATVDQDQDQSQSIPQPAQPEWTNTATNPAATQEQYTHTTTTIDSGTHGASPDMSGNSEVNTILTASRIQNLQYLNLTSFVLTSMIVIGVVFWGVREEGVWSDDYSWMRYQTLINPSPYVKYIWYLLFATQALFIHASIFGNKNKSNNTNTINNNPLIGYHHFSILSDNTGGTFKDLLLSAKSSVVAHYPCICLATVGVVYAHDVGSMGAAFGLSSVCLGLLGRVLMIQMVGLESMEDEREENNDGEEEESSNNGDGDVERQRTIVANLSPVDEEHPSLAKNGAQQQQQQQQDNNNNDNDTKHPLSHNNLHQYITLRLPFELFAGYTLTNVFLYLNMWLDQFDNDNVKVLLIVANISLVGMLVIGSVVMWKSKMLYGVGGSLIWYFVGVANELRSPSQPIYNEFTDEQITVTQAMAAIASTVLLIMLAVRMIKTVIKRNLFNCFGNSDGSVVSDDDDDDVVEVGAISTGYVAA